MESNRIAVMIAYRDRPSELGFLLLSLRNQTYKNFDIFISDDASGTPIANYHFLMCIFNKMNEEGNFITYERNPFNLGVSKNRQKLVEMSKGYELLARVDDDVILANDYFERLLEVINSGFDIASGITPFMGQPMFKRDTDFLKGIINRVIFDKEGNFIMNGDSCGMPYTDSIILPADHFRSCALYKSLIHDKISYDSNLSKHGFREEQILSFKAIINGFKIGVDTGAVAWHLLTPSGGERFSNSNELIKLNQEVFEEFTKKMFKEHGDFIHNYHLRNAIFEEPMTELELLKSDNLRTV